MVNLSKRKVLAAQEPSMTALITVLVDEYGTEVLNWDPETIALEVRDDFKVNLSTRAMDRICAGQQILTTDEFYTSLPDFNIFCTTLSDDPCEPDTWEPADAYDIVSAVAEVRLIAPPDRPIEVAFDPEILAYMIVALKDEHVIQPPECLSFIPADALATTDLGAVANDPVMFQAGYEDGLEKSAELQNHETMVLSKIIDELTPVTLENGSLDILKILSKERRDSDEAERASAASSGWI